MPHPRPAPTLSHWLFAASIALALVAGAALRWSALDSGFFLDDFAQAAMIEGVYPVRRAPLDLFTFTDGSPEDHARLMDRGALPWWTTEGLRLSMMRPLSSALILLDHRLFGADPLPYHVHSLLWWALSMLAAAWLLAELFPPAVACVAIVFFALEEGHTMPLGWLANRGALVAMCFGLLSITLHVRARRTGSLAGRAASFLCFSIALLSGEWAFPLLGYLLAYELMGRDGALQERALALLPAVLASAVFLLARGALRYGALNSGVYIDPVSEPLPFLLAACQRIPIFFADLFFSVPAIWWGVGTPWRDTVLSLDLFSPSVWLRLPSWSFWHVLLGVFAALTALLTLRWGLRERPSHERRQLRFLLSGALLSLLPMVASFPTSRLVLPASVAVCAAVAFVVLRASSLVRAHWRSAPPIAARAAAVLGAVLYFQGWEAGRTSFHEARSAHSGYESVRRWVLDAEVDDRTVSRQRVVLVNSLEHTSTIFFPFVRWFHGHPMPKSTWALSVARNAHDLRRPAKNVLEMSAIGGTFLQSDFEQLYRDERFPMRAGESVDIEGLRVEVVRTSANRPQTVRFTFERDVNDAAYLFLESTPEGLVRARLPEVGGRVRFRRAATPNHGLQRFLRGLRDPNVACAHARPPLDECRVGFFFADCGGSGEPVFACHLFGDCRWFQGGCVADGYETSSCSARNLCCAGGFPFAADSLVSEPAFARHLRSNLQTWGQAPWDGERDMNLSVQIEPALQQVTPLLRCHGAPERSGLCDLDRVDVPPPQRHSLRLSFCGPQHDSTWCVVTEVIEDREGSLRGRVCRIALPYAPPLGDVEQQVCPRSEPPVCASSGEILLGRFPLEDRHLPLLSARFRAHFDDGMFVEGEL